MPIAYIVVVIVALMANTPPSFGETVSPNAKLKIILESNQRETMILEASKFAVEKGFSFEDIGAQLPPLKDRRVVHLRLKRQNRMEIHISNELADDTFFLGIYERKPAQQWQAVWDDLIAAFRAQCLIRPTDLLEGGGNYKPVERDCQ